MNDDMPEEQRIEAARIRDEAAAAAQGDRSAWAHLLDVIHAPDARVKQLEEIAQAVAWVDDNEIRDECPHCREMQGCTVLIHRPTCPVTIARILYPPK